MADEWPEMSSKEPLEHSLPFTGYCVAVTQMALQGPESRTDSDCHMCVKVRALMASTGFVMGSMTPGGTLFAACTDHRHT